MRDFTCRICGNREGNVSHTAREMMFGTREPFDYIECGRCGCVQMANVPEDLSKYYPDDYYAFGAPRREGRVRAFLQRRRAAHLLERPNIVGRIMVRVFGVPPTIDYVRRCGVGTSDSVLEVGSGSGERLLAMRAYGFTNLTGVDPYVDRSLDYRGVRILKCELADYDGKHDMVMLHHTFEHMGSPRQVLERIRALLVERGVVLIRIPVASSEAFETYGVDWVQFDAPRHLYLHTRKSIDLLAGATGFDVTDVVYDSTAFQFWGSEQYRRDIPLRDARSFLTNPRKSIFTPSDIKAFESKARELNAIERGDQACFYLRKE